MIEMIVGAGIFALGVLTGAWIWSRAYAGKGVVPELFSSGRKSDSLSDRDDDAPVVRRTF